MKKNKKVLIIVLVILSVALVTGIILGYLKILKPYNEAVEKYNEKVKVIEEKNTELDNKIERVHNLIDSNEKVIDERIIETAKDVAKRAGASKFIINKMPKTTKEIITRTEELNTPPDYTEIIKELDNVYDSYNLSIKQYKQLTNPSQEFILQRLQTIDEVSDARAVTEDNDPNGKLNKAGGYTSTVYFESKKVNQKDVYGTDVIDKGTNAGGSIEVYANEEDAKKRENYLAGFDGSILSSGSHRVVGTVLIRTSDKLNATQQKELEQKIINAFIEIKE